MSRIIAKIYLTKSNIQCLLTSIDLLPGETYTVYISSENAITDQVPEEQFSAISTSLIVSTEAGIDLANIAT